MLVLDTDHVSLFEWANSQPARRLRARLEQALQEEWFTTIITYEEQTRGRLSYAAKARTVAQFVEAYGKLHRHLETYRTLRVLDFDEASATHFQHLRKQRIRIGTQDLKIAAIVLSHNATLLSRNLGDFHRIPGLKVEDWTA